MFDRLSCPTQPKRRERKSKQTERHRSHKQPFPARVKGKKNCQQCLDTKVCSCTGVFVDAVRSWTKLNLPNWMYELACTLQTTTTSQIWIPFHNSYFGYLTHKSFSIRAQMLSAPFFCMKVTQACDLVFRAEMCNVCHTAKGFSFLSFTFVHPLHSQNEQRIVPILV